MLVGSAPKVLASQVISASVKENMLNVKNLHPHKQGVLFFESNASTPQPHALGPGPTNPPDIEHRGYM